MDEWYSVTAAEPDLPMEGGQQLRDVGFVIMQGFVSDGDLARMSVAYDKAVLTADSSDVSIRSSTRVNDFVNRGPEFDGIYIYGPLLAACRQVIGRPFKLSALHARTLEPGAPAQRLHVDVKREADGWPLVGFIVMVDEFTTENGATRFVPGSHLQSNDPDELPTDATDSKEALVYACGSVGSIIVFNGSVRHGHLANRSTGRRRSIQGAFIPREAQASTNSHIFRMRPETLRRIGDLAKYILAV